MKKVKEVLEGKKKIIGVICFVLLLFLGTGAYYFVNRNIENNNNADKKNSIAKAESANIDKNQKKDENISKEESKKESTAKEKDEDVNKNDESKKIEDKNAESTKKSNNNISSNDSVSDNSNESSLNSEKSEQSETEKPLQPDDSSDNMNENYEPECHHKWEIVDIEKNYDIPPVQHLGACSSCGKIIENSLTGEDLVKEHMLETGHGQWHGDFYNEGYCTFCGGHIAFRQCAWGDVVRERCKNSENFVYIEEIDGNALMYYEVCSCGENLISVNEDGKGIISVGKEQRCVYCNERRPL